MSDTVVFQSATPATPPAGEIIATDDAGAAGQVQIIKLAMSANGSATPVTVDSDGVLVNLGSNNDVTVASLPLPSGASTSAKQDTGNTSLASIVTALGEVQASPTTNTVLDRLKALLTGIVLAAGTNAIGKLAANSGVDIGDVDVTSSALPSGASTSANQSTEQTLIGAVTETAPATDTASSGLNGRLQRIAQRLTTLLNGGLPAALAANGGLKIEGVAGGVAVPVSLATLPVTNAGTFVVQENGSALTALQLIDDTVITDDTTTFTPTTNKGLAIAAAVDDDSTDAADEGDMVIVRATKERKLRVVSALDSAHMQSGNDQVVPKFAVIAASSSGDNTLVTGVASKKIRVLNYVLMSNGTVNAKFQSSTGGDISGLLYMVANTGASSGYAPTGHFETVAGEDLQLNLSGAVAVGGHLSYIEVD